MSKDINGLEIDPESPFATLRHLLMVINGSPLLSAIRLCVVGDHFRAEI